MNKEYMRARVEEILAEYPELDSLDAQVTDALVEHLVAEFTKIEMEDIFDIDAASEDLDELDEG